MSMTFRLALRHLRRSPGYRALVNDPQAVLREG
jgi:hypothetical protein